MWRSTILTTTTTLTPSPLAIILVEVGGLLAVEDRLQPLVPVAQRTWHVPFRGQIERRARLEEAAAAVDRRQSRQRVPAAVAVQVVVVVDGVSKVDHCALLHDATMTTTLIMMRI